MLDKPAFSIIGIGGAGIKVLGYIQEEGVRKLAIDCDPYFLAFSGCERQIDLSEPLHISHDIRREVTLYASALLRRDEIRDAIEGDIVILVAGLGGATGTGVGPAVASIAREKGLPVLGFLIWPFQGEKLEDVAEVGLEALRQNCDATLVLDNNSAFEASGGESHLEASTLVNEMAARMVDTLVDQVSGAFPFSVHDEIAEFLRAMPAVNERVSLRAAEVLLDLEVGDPVAMSSEGIIRVRQTSNSHMSAGRSSADDEL